jgi:hypothetical protein
MVMPYILDTSCSTKSLDNADGGEDGVISINTSIMPYPSPVETQQTDDATSHKSLPYQL